MRCCRRPRICAFEPHELRAGDALRLGVAQVNVLAPLPAYQPGPSPTNNDSMVLRVAYGQTSVLLEGDAEAPVEEAMLGEAGLASTLLKVGHHGSVTSTTPEFLARVAPKWAVISCGLHNRFGHPRPEILAELEQAHVRTFSHRYPWGDVFPAGWEGRLRGEFVRERSVRFVFPDRFARFRVRGRGRWSSPHTCACRRRR